MRVLIAGYYGFGNIGDEAILAAIIQQLRALPDPPEIEVLSAAPDHTAATYEVLTADRWRLSSVAAAIRRCDLLVQGGGGLIQDATSRLSPAYYLGLLALARARRRPYVIFAQGLGPLRSRLWQRLTVGAFARARAVILRDAASADLLRRWGFRGEITVAADPALLLRPAQAADLAHWLSQCAAPLDRFTVLVPRAIEGYEPVLTRAAALLAQSGPLAVLPFQASDEPLCRRLTASLPAGARAFALPTPPDPAIAAALVARAQAVVTMRFHALVFAAAARRPALALAHDPKLEIFAQTVGYRCLADPSPEKLANVLGERGDGLTAPDRAAVADQISRAAAAFDRLATTISDLRAAH